MGGIIEKALQACLDAIVGLLRRVCPSLSEANVDDVIRDAAKGALKELEQQPKFRPAGGWQQWLMNRALQDGLYREYRKLLVGYLQRVFPSVRQEDPEDLVQYVFFKDIVEKLQQVPNFTPHKGWLAWLLWRCSCRMKDVLRLRHEVPWVDAFSKQQGGDAQSGHPFEPAGAGPSPSQLLMADEKTERRRKLLSGILDAYCRDCEDYCRRLEERGQDGWKKRAAVRWEEREVFERSLRQQPSHEIASQMGIPRQRVYERRVSARGRLRAIVGKADIRGSLFGTALFDPEDDRQGNRQEDRCRGRHKAPLLEQQTLDALRRMVDETAAMCPSHEALKAATHDAVSPAAHAVNYHVRAAVWYFESADQQPGCPTCRRHLGFLGDQP